jgi:hypothetical protein
MGAPRPGLLAMVAGLALLTAACSGGGASGSPQVASLGNATNSSGTGGGNATRDGTPAGNPTALLDEWAACIRRHGDPNQVDPTIDSSKDIEITMDNVPEGLAGEVHAGTGPCSRYLLAASSALRGGQQAATDNPVQDAKFADCMRANGFPNWPNSVNGQSNFQGTGINPNSPAVNSASNRCDKKVGGGYGTDPGGVIQVQSCNAPPGKQCPSHGPGGLQPAPNSSAG